MQCDKNDLDLMGYIDGDLRKKEQENIEQHLQSCEACHAQYEWLLETLNVIESEQEMPINPFFYAKIVNRLKLEKTKAMPSLWVPSLLKPLGIAASILIGIYFGSGEVFENEIALATQDEVQLDLLTPEYDEFLLAFNE
jgi:predicted anti-sigma-YlaC factor YlaD